MTAHTFYKYQGAGNDFVIFDNREGFFDVKNTDLVRRLCDRRFGIGADGLMLLQDSMEYDFEMVYCNADGRESSMCGNGGRCIVAFAKHLGIIADTTVFLAVDGVHRAMAADTGEWVSLQMIDVKAVQRDGESYVLDTGSPHHVQVVESLEKYPVFQRGREIRYSSMYSEKGINVNFVQSEGKGYFVRTYERGVEDETLACGTGVTAAALAMAVHHGQEGDLEIPIRVMGGHLNVRFKREGDTFTNIFLEGPAKLVFEGKVEF